MALGGFGFFLFWFVRAEHPFLLGITRDWSGLVGTRLRRASAAAWLWRDKSAYTALRRDKTALLLIKHMFY